MMIGKYEGSFISSIQASSAEYYAAFRATQYVRESHTIRDLRASEYAGGSHPFNAGGSLLHLLLFGRISADSIGERAGSSVRIVLQNGWLRLVYRPGFPKYVTSHLITLHQSSIFSLQSCNFISMRHLSYCPKIR